MGEMVMLVFDPMANRDTKRFKGGLRLMRGVYAAPNWNTANQTLTISNDTIIFYGESYMVTTSNIVIETKVGGVTANGKILFDVENKSFRYVYFRDEIFNSEIVVCVVKPDTRPYLMDVSFEFTIDGKPTIPSIPLPYAQRTALGSAVNIICPMDGKLPDIDTVNNTLTFFNDTILQWGNLHYAIKPENVIDLSVTNSTTKKVIFDPDKKVFIVGSYSSNVIDRMFVVATIRTQVENVTMSIACPYTVDGKLFGKITETIVNPLDAMVRAVAHRGYSVEAPENTLPSYTLAKQKGFSYVECDISWSKDNIPVLLHDNSINRTSNGSGAIGEHTLSEIKTYDFGSWKNAKYAGTKIPTLEEFLLHCKSLSLHPYLELKGTINTEQAQTVVKIVKHLDMLKNVTWISFSKQSLFEIDSIEPNARLGLVGSMSKNLVNDAISLITNNNVVFVDSSHGEITKDLVIDALDAGISVEAWTVNNETYLKSLVKNGVSGITTDFLNVNKVLQNNV